MQEVAWSPAVPDASPAAAASAAVRPDDDGVRVDGSGKVTFAWRPVRPIPEDDDFFENVWREYREHRNVV